MDEAAGDQLRWVVKELPLNGDFPPFPGIGSLWCCVYLDFRPQRKRKLVAEDEMTRRRVLAMWRGRNVMGPREDDEASCLYNAAVPLLTIVLSRENRLPLERCCRFRSAV